MSLDHSAFPLHEGAFPGLTKRELFAAMAMQALISGGALTWDPADRMDLSWRAVNCADALIAELSK